MKNKKIGVWLDFEKAMIINTENVGSSPLVINSEIEDYKVKGGSASKTPWGPVDTISESKLLNRRNQQKTNYYKAISKCLKDIDEVLIFGPAEAKIGLQKYIEGLTFISPSIIGPKNVKYMTENQKIEFVRDHFKITRP